MVNLMQNNMLGICVPTYNRASFLIQTVSQIIKQAKVHNIPIYISDNGSIDNTFDIVNELKRNYEFIYYQRVETNLGIDRNIINVVKMANTSFVWLFGDDDLIEENAISEILKKISLDFDLIIVNSSTNNVDFSRIIEERHYKIYEDKSYFEGDYSKLLIDTVSYTTFLGALVVRKKLWESVPYDSFLETDFVHTGIIYSYIIGHKTYIISKPYIKIRLQNASWSKRQFVVWMINWPKVIWNLPKAYTNDLKKSIICEKPYYTWKSILLFRALNSYDKILFNKYVKNNSEITIFNKFMHFIIVTINHVWLRNLLLMRLKLLKVIFKFDVDYEIERLSYGD